MIPTQRNKNISTSIEKYEAELALPLAEEAGVRARKSAEAMSFFKQSPL